MLNHLIFQQPYKISMIIIPITNNEENVVLAGGHITVWYHGQEPGIGRANLDEQLSRPVASLIHLLFHPCSSVSVSCKHGTLPKAAKSRSTG